MFMLFYYNNAYTVLNRTFWQTDITNVAKISSYMRISMCW